MRFAHDTDLLQGLLTPNRSPRFRPKALSAKARAEAHRIAALKALAHWGHLRCGELARMLWPQAKCSEQMAARLMRRLESERAEVASRLNAIGTRSYVLTRRGAAALDLVGVSAHHGMELSSVAGATCIHRLIGTAYGIAKAEQGFETFGEHAIAQGGAPAARQALAKRFLKLPDLLLVRGDKVTWVEVEASAKPMRDLQACVRIATAVGQPLLPGSPLTLAGVVFVFDQSQGHAQRIARAARQLWSERSKSERETLARRITLAHVDVGPLVRWQGFRETPLGL